MVGGCQAVASGTRCTGAQVAEGQWTRMASRSGLVPSRTGAQRQHRLSPQPAREAAGSRLAAFARLLRQTSQRRCQVSPSCGLAWCPGTRAALCSCVCCGPSALHSWVSMQQVCSCAWLWEAGGQHQPGVCPTSSVPSSSRWDVGFVSVWTQKPQKSRHSDGTTASSVWGLSGWGLEGREVRGLGFVLVSWAAGNPPRAQPGPGSVCICT